MCHVTVKLLLLIYCSIGGQALKVGKPISSSARCWAFYSYLHKVIEHSIARFLSIVSSALVVQWATPCTAYIFPTLAIPCPLNQYSKMPHVIFVINLMFELVVHPKRLLIAYIRGCLDAAHKIVPPCLSPLKVVQSHPC